MKFGLHFLLLLFGTSFLHGYLDPGRQLSQFGVSRWNLEDGLRSNWVSDICQKSNDPFVWLGTPTGLVRFNGVSFEVYDVNDSPLLEGGAWALETGEHGRLWIGTRNHGVVYYERGEFFQLSGSDGEKLPEVRMLKMDSSGRLWIGTPSGLFVYEAGVLSPFEYDQMKGAFLTAIHQDKQGGLWFGTQDHGLFFMSSDGLEVRHLSHLSIASSTIYCVESDLHGNLWVGTKSGLHRMRDALIEEVFTTADGLPSNSVRALHLDSSGCIFVGTESGITRIYQGKIIENKESAPFDGDFITCFLEDSEGSLWVGSKYGGFGQLWRGKFVVYSTEEGLRHPVVNVVYEDVAHRIWIGTNSGLHELKDNTVSPRYEDILGDERIRDIFQDSKENLWVCTYNGLFKINGKDVRQYGVEEGLTSSLVRQVLEDREGRIWIGTRAGLVMFDGDTIRQWTTPELLNDLILHIYEDRKGQVWIASDGAGIARFDGEKFNWYTVEDGLSNGVVFKIYEDRKGLFWLSTASGLSVYNGKTFLNLSRIDGLPSETIFQVLEDSFGFLWLTAHEGIFKIRKSDIIQYLTGRRQRFEVTTYGTLDGLRTNQMTGVGESVILADGKFIFATAEGASLLDLPKLNLNPLKPEVYFEKIVVNGKPTFIDGKPKEIIQIGGGVKTLRIDFTSNSLIGASNVLFATRLLGFDDSLNEGNDRFISLTNLDPGDYRFEVRARNSDGIWGHEVGVLEFQVKHYFHQTIWFYILIVVLSMIGGYALYAYRIVILRKQSRDLEEKIADRTEEITRQKEIIELKVLENEKNLRALQASNQELKKLNEEKSNFLGVVAHDMKNPLGNIIFLSEELLAQNKDPLDEESDFVSMIHQSSQELLELVDTLVHSISLESGQIVLEKDSENISVLATSVVAMNQKAADAKAISLSLKVPEFLVGYIDSLRLRTAMDNFVSNAIKYTPSEGAIEVELLEIKDAGKHFFEFRVVDNGPGLIHQDFSRVFERFSKLSARPTGDESSSGLGLFIVKQIVELHGGSVAVKNNDEGGACFSFAIPLV